MLQTVNSLLSMQKSLKQRMAQLETVKASSGQRTRYMSLGDRQERVEEPLYDIKKLDKKVTEINKALLKIDQEIKRSNAATTVEILIDFDNLMSEVE